MKDHTKSKAELISELQALRKRNHELESQERDENIEESQKKYKALFEESENLAGILHQSTDSIMLCDLDGNIKYVNPMFEKITGYTFEEVKEKKPKILRPDHPPYPKNFYKTMWATLLKGKIWKGEFINKKKNNQTFIEEAAIFPFRELDSGKITGYCAVKKDITNSRNMEEQLKKSYHKMAELKNKAEASNRLKSKFLANISHDIRTPLNAVMGFTNLLSKNEQSKKNRGYLKKIKSASEGLLNLINDLLDFSKIEVSQLNIYRQTFTVKDLIDGIVALFEIQFKSKGVNFEIFISPNVPTAIYNDKWRISQLLTNLLSNALKFTGCGSVDVLLDYRENRDILEFKIIDTGIGIEQQNLERIFDPFTQIESPPNFPGQGTGLGLAICKKLANLMGGTITVTSTHGKGTEFTVEIPANLKEIQSAYDPLLIKPGEINRDELKQKTILIVDDNPVNMELIKELFENEGFTKLLSADNGEKAVRVAQKNNPDLTLMDIQMPVMDGNEAIATLREAGFKKPIVALSAFAMKEDIDISMSLGANGYITKPIDFETFFERIAAFLIKKDTPYHRSLPDKSNQNTTTDTPNYKINTMVSKGMKNIFLLDIQNTLELISSIIKKNNMKEGRKLLHFIAHSNNESAKFFGFPELQSITDELTQAIKEKSADILITILAKSLAALLNEILIQNTSEKNE